MSPSVASVRREEQSCPLHRPPPPACVSPRGTKVGVCATVSCVDVQGLIVLINRCPLSGLWVHHGVRTCAQTEPRKWEDVCCGGKEADNHPYQKGWFYSASFVGWTHWQIGSAVSADWNNIRLCTTAQTRTSSRGSQFSRGTDVRGIARLASSGHVVVWTLRAHKGSGKTLMVE